MQRTSLRYAAWIVVAAVLLLSVAYAAKLYLEQGVYSKSLRLVCSEGYTTGLFIYSVFRGGGSLRLSAECSPGRYAEIDVALVGAVNASTTLTCGSSRVVPLSGSGLLAVYFRVESCRGGDVWMRVELAST